MSETAKRIRTAKWRGFLTTLERSFLIGGALLLGLYTAARIHSFVMSRAALRSAGENRPTDIRGTNVPVATLPGDSSVAAETSLWSKLRIKAYLRNAQRPQRAVAVLRIRRLQMEAPVLEGTDYLTLNSGVGRIAGTARLGEPGNVGIAGHRDSFFRPLKNIRSGDIIELDHGHRIATYTVVAIKVTSPNDTSVLQQSRRPELTLVTCYPFYFVGPAPQRFIVQAFLNGNDVRAKDGRF